MRCPHPSLNILPNVPNGNVQCPLLLLKRLNFVWCPHPSLNILPNVTNGNVRCPQYTFGKILPYLLVYLPVVWSKLTILENVKSGYHGHMRELQEQLCVCVPNSHSWFYQSKITGFPIISDLDADFFCSHKVFGKILTLVIISNDYIAHVIEQFIFWNWVSNFYSPPSTAPNAEKLIPSFLP